MRRPDPTVCCWLRTNESQTLWALFFVYNSRAIWLKHVRHRHLGAAACNLLCQADHEWRSQTVVGAHHDVDGLLAAMVAELDCRCY
jgi:hypothetical protein